MFDILYEYYGIKLEALGDAKRERLKSVDYLGNVPKVSSEELLSPERLEVLFFGD